LSKLPEFTVTYDCCGRFGEADAGTIRGFSSIKNEEKTSFLRSTPLRQIANMRSAVQAIGPGPNKWRHHHVGEKHQQNGVRRVGVLDSNAVRVLPCADRRPCLVAA